MMGPSRMELKKALYRLIVAGDDLTESRLTICALLEQVRDTPNPQMHSLFYPMFHAAVIAYARPFTKNEPLGALPDKFARFENPKFATTHAFVLEHRDRFVAHSDQLEKKVHLLQTRHKLWPDRPPVKSYGHILLRPSATTEQLDDINRTALDVYMRIHEAQSDLTARIYDEYELPPGPFPLELNDAL